MTIQMKDIEQQFPVLLLVLLHWSCFSVVLKFKSVGGTPTTGLQMKALLY